ncbi:MAG: M28 family peptidase, partial [Cyanobacteria bacterium REEB65]|nr:M28 family peptidase [Cyanobacteria bacterium REEB65]
KRDQPILGADDGASGVAVALEIGRIVRPAIPVRILLFDGEDLGRNLATFFQGSRHYAASLGTDRPRAALLLDMVGQKGLQIEREALSERADPALLDRVFATAARLHSRVFVDAPGQLVYDDHYPLLQAGIPAIDLIDLDYPAWHTTFDTPENCSKAALGAVGEVVAQVIASER